MLQVHGEMNYNGAEAVGNFRIVGNPYLIALRQSCPFNRPELRTR